MILITCWASNCRSRSNNTHGQTVVPRHFPFPNFILIPFLPVANSLSDYDRYELTGLSKLRALMTNAAGNALSSIL